METGLTPDDVLLLSAWAASEDGSTSGSASEDPTPDVSLTRNNGASAAATDDLRLLFDAIDNDAQELSATDAPRRTRKKRRATYLRTKEERESLQAEITALESRLAVLKKRAGIVSDAGVEVMAVNSALLRGVIQQQQMAMASAQSMMTKSVHMQDLHPLYTPVHLGKEWAARRRTMLALKDTKLRSGRQYLTERSRHHDELLPYASQEISQDSKGNINCTLFDMVQFPGVRSLREVYDATHYFFLNEEMVIAERLGHVAIRDDYDIVDGAAANSRMYWIDQNGVMTEWNAVCFAQLFDGKTKVDRCECGVLVTDSVDTDALYEYQSASRVRRDLSGAIMLTVANATDGDSTVGDGGLVVIMRRAAVIKLHRASFALSNEAKEVLIKSVSGWSQAMTDTIRARLSVASTSQQ